MEGGLFSVIDIRMKKGNMKKFHAEGSVGIVASKLTIEGPIIKDKTSFIVSGRRTYVDLLAKPFIALHNKKQESKYRAAIISGTSMPKSTTSFPKSNRLFASAISADRFLPHLRRLQHRGDNGSPALDRS